MFRALVLLFMTLLLVGCGTEKTDPPSDTTEVSTAYLGQTPPGMTPELFAPDILPTESIQHCVPAFSPDGREVYWTTYNLESARPSAAVYFMKETEGIWSEPAIAPFSGGDHSDYAPMFAPDGQRLYFGSRRPSFSSTSMNIWYVTRTDAGWSEPVILGSPPNSENGSNQASFTSDGTMYSVGRNTGCTWNVGIYRSRFVDGMYQPPELLGSQINTADADSYPYIAHDESYLLFGSSRPGAKSVETDLYIAFRNEDDTWSEPQRLGDEINNGKTVSFACVSHDGKYLFFNRFGDDDDDKFYWVDARILDQYRP
jgi:hypothetical protein